MTLGTSPDRVVAAAWRVQGEAVATSGPTPQPTEGASVYHVGDVRLDLDRFELQRGGVPQRVEPQVLEVLGYLIRHRDRLVTKQELMDQVWHDRFVSDSAITSRVKAARRATGDDGDRQNVIRTVHGRGYRFVAPLAAGTPPAPPPTVLTAAHCVGRSHELATLRRSLAKAGSGVRQVVLVSGEPGIGKTTLVEAFLAGLPPGQGIVGLGQSHPVGVGEPYAPVLEALSDLAKGVAADAVRRRLDELAPGWLLQLPALVDAGHASSLATRTLGSTPERMLREALDLFDELARLDGGPLIVVVEDLHWADRSTLDLLTAVARRRKPAPLLLVGTYRHTDVDDADVLSTTVTELVVRGLATDVRLEALSLDAANELVSQHPGVLALLTRDAVAALYRRSGGNPLFLGALLDVGADAASTRPADLPRSLREMVERHLDRLEPEDRDLLDTAAVAGIEFAVELLGSGPEAENASRRCQLLARRDRLITFDEAGRPGRFRFRHALYQEVTYSRMAPSKVRRLHQAVGERLEAVMSDGACSAAELAEHFTRSGDARRSVRYRLDAGSVAAARSAPAAALSHLHAGLQMLPLLPDGEERLRFEADLLASSAAMTVTVEGFASVQAEQGLHRARELYLQLTDTAAANRTAYALAGLYEYRGEFDRSRPLMEQRLQTAAGGEQAMVELHDLLACSTFHLGAFADALRHAEVALARYDPVRDRATLAMVGENAFVSSQHWAAYCLWFTGRAEQALERSDAAVRFARRPDHAFSLCHALEQAAMLRQLFREPDRVVELADELLTLAVEFGLPYRQATAGMLLGWAHGALDDPLAGCRQLDQSLAAYRRTGAAIDLPYYLILHADVALRAGRLDAAQHALTEVRALSRLRPTFVQPEIERLTAALLSRTDADPRTIETHLRAALATAQDRTALALELRAAADLCRLQLATGRPSDAGEVLRSVVERFSEGLDRPDLHDASALLTPHP
jgi:DNA-binding winged helix-turn-helix (wHTH) protein/tetratricopeptide (TPR) repeat protein